MKQHCWLIRKNNNLSDEEVAQLRFLHFNPGNIDPESDIADMLNAIEENAVAELENTLKIPFPGSYTPPVDNTRFNATINVAYDDAFEAALQEGVDSGTLDIGALAEELGLTEKEVIDHLTYLHFNPEAAFPGSETLAAVVASLENIAMQSIKSEFGIVGDFTAETGSFYYNAVFEGEFSRLFINNLQNTEPPLTEDDINEIMAMLADPLNSEIASHPIFLQTVGEVKGIYNLPSTWMPPIEDLEYLTDISFNVRTAWNCLNSMEELVETATLLISSFPDSPEKALLLNFLKVVSQAMARLREQIAVMQIMDARIGQELSTIRMETTIYKIDLQEKKQKAAEESKQKEGLQTFLKFMGPVGKIMEVVMLVVIMTAACIVLGPIAGPIIAVLCLAMFVMKEAAPEALASMYKGIMDAFGDSEIGSFMGMVVCLVVSVAGGYSGAGAFFEHSGAVERFLVEGCGVDETTAMWVNMAFQIVVEVVIMIAMGAASGGATGALVIAKITAKVTQAMAKVAKLMVKVLNLAARMCHAAGRVGATLRKIFTYFGRLANQLARSSDDILLAANKIKQAQKALKTAKKSGNVFRIAREEQALAKAIDDFHDAMKTFERAYIWVTRIESAGNIVASSIRIDGAVRQAKLALIEAEIDAAIEDLKALLKILNKLIAIIMGGGDALGEWLVSTAEQMNRAWTDKSLTLSGIYEQQG